MAQQPSGVGGWLALLALAQSSAPLERLVIIVGNILAWILAPMEPSGATAERFGVVVVNFFLMVLSLYVAILLWRKSKDFQRFFFYQWIAILAWSVAAPLYAAATVGVPFDKLLDSHDFSELLGASIWLWYVTRSVRVRNTFVN
jgi:hypothetical protein